MPSINAFDNEFRVESLQQTLHKDTTGILYTLVTT